MFDLSLLRNPTFLGGLASAFAISGSAFAVLTFIVLYLQNVLGYSAVGAGLRCVVTVSSYTTDEDMSEAVLVVSSLGDPGEPAVVLANRGAAKPRELVTLTDLDACRTQPILDKEAV